MLGLHIRVVTNSSNVQRFMNSAITEGKLKDDIIDEHALLLFLEYLGERPKFNKRGEVISGTRIGAVMIFVSIAIFRSKV